MASLLLRQPTCVLRALGCYRRLHGDVAMSYSCLRFYTGNRKYFVTSPRALRDPVTSSSCHVTQQVRGYAKKGGKEKKSGKKGGKGQSAAAALSGNDMTEIVDLHVMKEQMEEVLLHLQSDMVEKLRLRTNVGTFENLTVETDDGTFPLIQIGKVIQKGPQLVVINMDNAAHYSKDVKQALAKSNLNVNPQQDGSSFFIPIPKVTREHREGIVKNAKALSSKAKDRLKAIQNAYSRELNLLKENHSSDLAYNIQEYIFQTTKELSARADSMVEAKQKELLD